MSWSFQAIGSPAKVIEKLEAEGERISEDPKDHCRQEFEEAKPHLVALVGQNFRMGKDGHPESGLLIKIAASGSCSWDRVGADSRKTSSYNSVQIESFWGYVC